MSDTEIKQPIWFWVISGLALIWNLMGVMAYMGTVSLSPEDLAKYPDAEQALYADIPAWATSAFAIAVFGGVIGCILLLLRRNLARTAFIVSLVAVLINNFYWYGLKNSLAITGIGNAILQASVVGIGVFLIWFTQMVSAKGWLR